MELKYTQFDTDGTLLRDLFFYVNNKWLEDYLGINNLAYLEAYFFISDDWDPTEIFNAAKESPEISGFKLGYILDYSLAK